MKTEQKHTPGPWHIVAMFPSFDQGIVTDGGVVVVRIDADSDTPSPDARLIAAAPDLLAALKHITSNCRVFCEDSMDIDDGAVYDARAAIAKAEGKA